MALEQLGFTLSPTNPKPQIIISTGSSYILDELYQGECIQIGGTRENNYFTNLTTHLYIKCQNEAGETKFVDVVLNDPEKNRHIALYD